MGYIQVLDSCHEQLKNTTAQVMGQEYIGINLMKPSNQCLNHLLLTAEDMDHSVCLLLEFLLQIER